MYKVGLYTLGCKVSSYETEAVGEAFERAGFLVSDFSDVCDVYVINTCTVTAESDAKSRKYIRRAIRTNPDAVVIVMGCYSQRSPEEVSEIEGVSAVIGTADKLAAPDIAIKLLGDRGLGKIVTVSNLAGTKFENMRISRAPRTRGYVKIEDGCECKCTYCAISSARGPVRSKRPEDIIDEIKTLYSGGTREIVLTGIETGSYGKDLEDGCDLASLLYRLSELGIPDRIRLGSMAPELLSEKFVTRVARLPILVPHFHISMQSGSTSVLNRMKRRYTRETALANIRRIRALMPAVMLTADLMVGFPGESEEEFLETVSFVTEAGLLDAHVFSYSRREGTPAAMMQDQVPDGIKKERSARLIAEKNRVRDAVLDGVVADGTALATVFETRRGCRYVGHSDSYIEICAEAQRDIRGEILNVIPTHHENGVVYGKIEK
ncbi:MAG: tRNA (N(6)-L-threonylcarbamoyladenosine(37)-C(2))-methylthiotransferase MtaB [Clostridia bacterium]|nr:tRNA (N(6)-L-threonylcarbamoyladenosine(37)-C(2))-methylthiotransferase MtaB [Clostridia bacterium]